MKHTFSAVIAVLVIVLVFFALLAFFGQASGMDTVLTVGPTQIPTVPAEGMDLFLNLLGF